MAAVRRWPDQTVVCLASGPSLTRDDVEYCRGKAPVIAVNDTYTWAPWADVLYACDADWWDVHGGVPGFVGEKFSLESRASKWGVQVLGNAGDEGVTTDPTELATGKNSGYQAINLAVHFGAKRIVLLGYDMQRTGDKAHFFGDHPKGLNTGASFVLWVQHFGTMATAMKRLGISVINCSRETALTCFPRLPLREVL